MKSDPLVLRGLRAFANAERLRPRLQVLSTEFHAAWSRCIDRTRESVALVGALWESDDPELHAALLPRIEWLVGEVADAWRALESAVEFGEVARAADLFADCEPPLSVVRTFIAMNEGANDPVLLERPLDRARIRRRRS